MKILVRLWISANTAPGPTQTSVRSSVILVDALFPLQTMSEGHEERFAALEAVQKTAKERASEAQRTTEQTREFTESLFENASQESGHQVPDSAERPRRINASVLGHDQPEWLAALLGRLQVIKASIASVSGAAYLRPAVAVTDPPTEIVRRRSDLQFTWRPSVAGWDYFGILGVALGDRVDGLCQDRSSPTFCGRLVQPCYRRVCITALTIRHGRSLHEESAILNWAPDGFWLQRNGIGWGSGESLSCWVRKVAEARDERRDTRQGCSTASVRPLKSNRKVEKATWISGPSAWCLSPGLLPVWAALASGLLFRLCLFVWSRRVLLALLRSPVSFSGSVSFRFLKRSHDPGRRPKDRSSAGIPKYVRFTWTWDRLLGIYYLFL